MCQDVSTHQRVIKSNHFWQSSYQNLPSFFNSRLIMPRAWTLHTDLLQQKPGEDAGRSDHGSAATQGATVWPGPFGLERNQWRKLQLRSKQILSGLKKEKETAIHCLFSHERGALTVTLSCWSKQKGSDSSCKLSYAISCYKTLQIVKVYWDNKWMEENSTMTAENKGTIFSSGNGQLQECIREGSA